MAKCVIFCAADFDSLAESVAQEDLLIAADGGLRHLNTLGLKPHVVLGDFDSLGYVPEGAAVFPVEKDDTDAMLAVRRGLALGFREFWIYGGMGGARLDHTVANLQTLEYLADHGARGFLIGTHQIAAVIREETLTFPAAEDGILSVFCMGADADGVTIRGLRYPLTGGTLSEGFPLGVSNHFIGEEAQITVKHGNLLVIWERRLGLPRRLFL